MKAHPHLKAKGTARVNSQQLIFGLKKRVVIALNKLADRDTYQIGVEELEKTIECLTPDGIAPFLSCILDTDSEQKSAVRKECIRLMGAIVYFHGTLIGPHLGKMVASIVKRLKDPDSVVRDACVETVGVLASRLGNDEGESEGVFIALVKPLFEALGEQNKQIQFGSALCLARVIDNMRNPPVSVLQRMLNRTIKLLKNPHFMAKPAVIELNRSIIQAGGAPTQSALSAAMTSIQEALKNSDWTTRKAASASLGEIASGGGSFFGVFKTSCIRSLELCRFDKVKPVRDTVLQALHLWRSLPGTETPEASEGGSSIKENFCRGDHGDVSIANESTWKDTVLTKVGSDSVKKRVPHSGRKASLNFVENPQHSKADDWHIEIAVPNTYHVSSMDVHNEESEGSSITKMFERTSTAITSPKDVEYEYVPMDDRQECSSVSNIVSDNFETKFMTVSHNYLEDGASEKPMRTNQRFAAEEISSEQQIYSAKMWDHRSLESTVTELSSPTMHGFCSQITNEMVSIKKQLFEIENNQSNLMDLFKVFTTSTMDTLSMIQLKVSGLEHAVNRIAEDLVHSKKSPSIASPRLSTCTPRPSIDICTRQPSFLSKKNVEVWDEKAFSRSSSAKQGVEMRTETTGKLSRNSIGKGSHRSSGQPRKNDIFLPASINGESENHLGTKNIPWNLVKRYLSEGDVESAYVEALCSAEELVLLELLDTTGPVLESLSHKTATSVLSTLASYFLNQRFINSIIPWLHQVVDLQTVHGPNYLALPVKTKREFLSAVEAANMEFSNPAERSITQLAMKLHQIWGNASDKNQIEAWVLAPEDLI